MLERFLKCKYNGLVFVPERCSLITATVCANVRYSICMDTPWQLYDYINPLLKYIFIS